MRTRAIPARPCKEHAEEKHEGHSLTAFRGMAPVAHVLFNKIMKFNPKNTKWLNRDRFVLS